MTERPHRQGYPLKPRIELPRDESACWEWIGRRQENGYGKLTYFGKDMLAHRWIWMMLFGPIPDGLVINHKCSNRGCINPRHLEVVTQAENTRHGVNTTLLAMDVEEIRRKKRGHGPQTANELAAKFGVSAQLIRDIWKRRAWNEPKPFYGARKNAPKQEAA